MKKIKAKIITTLIIISFVLVSIPVVTAENIDPGSRLIERVNTYFINKLPRLLQFLVLRCCCDNDNLLPPFIDIDDDGTDHNDPNPPKIPPP